MLANHEEAQDHGKISTMMECWDTGIQSYKAGQALREMHSKPLTASGVLLQAHFPRSLPPIPAAQRQT